MTWHVERGMLERYAHATIGDAHAFSVEAHLLSCEQCRMQVSTFIDGETLETIWAATEAVVFGPRKGPIERLLLQIGVKDHIARLLAATPSLRLSWLAAIAVALSFAVAASYFNQQGYVMFLILAPLLPVAGVAAAYGPGVDPTYEVGLAAPMRSYELLLIRALAVLIFSSVLVAVASLALPKPSWVTIAWLLPSLGLTSASLALSTVFKPLRAATGVAVAWVAAGIYAVIFVARSGTTLEDVFGELVQVILLFVTLASIALLYRRRETFERGVLR